MADKKNPVPELSRFEGRDVMTSTISVRRAGDGLSAALSVAPAEYHEGDTVYVVLETRVGAISYKPIRDTSALTREHVLITQHGSVVDGQAVADMLAVTKQLLAEKREQEAAEKGAVVLPGTGVADTGNESPKQRRKRGAPEQQDDWGDPE